MHPFTARVEAVGRTIPTQMKWPEDPAVLVWRDVFSDFWLRDSDSLFYLLFRSPPGYASLGSLLQQSQEQGAERVRIQPGSHSVLCRDPILFHCVLMKC